MTELDVTDVLGEDVQRKMTELWNEVVGSPARYMCWTDKRGSEYFHTVEKVKDPKGRMRYASGIYRHIKSKNQLILRKQVYHSKKWKAIERAYKLYCKATKQKYSPYTPSGMKAKDNGGEG